MNPSAILNSFLQRARRGARMDPARDWLVLIMLSTIVLAGIVVWNLWVFDVVAGGGAIASAPATTASPTVPDRASLDAIRALFEKRATEHEKYSTDAYRYVDPSQ